MQAPERFWEILEGSNTGKLFFELLFFEPSTHH